jgi:hypothetical protein
LLFRRENKKSQESNSSGELNENDLIINLSEIESSYTPLLIPGEEVDTYGGRFFYQEVRLHEDQLPLIAEAVYNKGVYSTQTVPIMIPEEITMLAEEIARKLQPTAEKRAKIISVMTNAIGYEMFGEGTQDETQTYLLERAAERAYKQGIEGIA